MLLSTHSELKNIIQKLKKLFSFLIKEEKNSIMFYIKNKSKSE